MLFTAKQSVTLLSCGTIAKSPFSYTTHINSTAILLKVYRMKAGEDVMKTCVCHDSCRGGSKGGGGSWRSGSPPPFLGDPQTS